jgi:hypothetical protein
LPQPFKHANPRNSTRTGRNARTEVLACDAANRDDRKLTEIARNFSQLIQTLRFTERTLRLRIEDWTEDYKVSTRIARRTRLCERVSRNTNQKLRPANLSDNIRPQRVRRQMHTIRSCAARNIDAIIYKHTRRRPARDLNRLNSEIVKHSCWK